ncbi:AI-2E family transporter [Caulobacter sp. S45]|uniref:AI-2E family transporter n=1 Tax=Caulobacter sp. S45 TaxID=1641861 RepID=UPI00131B7F95|nr:AI-2E family transporter [Caulobacter sp. S45]
MATNSGVARNALVVIAAILGGYTLYWLREILTPLALSIFLVVMIDGLARLLAQRVPRMPPWAPLPLALLLSVVAAGLVVYAVAANAASFAAQLLSETARLNLLIAKVAGAFGVRVPPTLSQIINQLNPSRYVGDVARALQSFASGAVYVLVYLGFLIASRQGFQHKAVALFPSSLERDGAATVFYRIRDSLQRYLWIQTVTGLMIAIASALAMYALGLQNAIFWAFLILVLSFVPVIGGAIGSILPPLFALVQFPTLWQAVVLALALQVIGFVVGNVIQPRMQRDSLNIDPVVVLLSLALWGAVWGLPGMFLSTPLTVTAITILAQFDGSRWIAILLSGDGEPEGRPNAAGQQAILPSPSTA